jgi:hypothetical protein
VTTAVETVAVLKRTTVVKSNLVSMAGLVIVTVTATVFILEDETLDDFGSAVLVGTVDELDEGGFYGDAEVSQHY